MVDIQSELEKELRLLQNEFGYVELVVEWHPRPDNKVKMFDKKQCELCGEVIDRVIHIYLLDCEECLHTIRHEFSEYVIDKELLGDIIDAYNTQRQAYERNLTKSLYKRKEAYIENMVKLIEKSRRAGDKK